MPSPWKKSYGHGNARIFMVKAMAEEACTGIPGFFACTAGSCGVLLPLFVLLILIFFPGTVSPLAIG